MQPRSHLTLETATEWRAPVWAPAVDSVLTRGSQRLPAGSRILELGFNSGSMSCYMHLNYGWQVFGVDLFEAQVQRARTLRDTLSISAEHVDFKAHTVEEIQKLQGSFDGIFLKSVLYHITDFTTYLQYLDHLHTLLRPGGLLMAVENGQGHALDRFYRKQLAWGENLLYNSRIEAAFRERFAEMDVKYFGGISQYLTWCPSLCRSVQSAEKTLYKLGPDNCFIASIVALKA